MNVTTAPPEGSQAGAGGPPAGVPPDDVPPVAVPLKPRGRGAAWRLLLGSLIVLVASAATSAVIVSGEVQTLRKDLSQNPSLQVAPGTLASAGWGDPQTLLLVGDDQRALTKYYHQAVLPHANEMLLVRLDPSKPYISMMSIPRELQVTIYPPNAAPATTRFNYAYTAGGIPLLVTTIKQVLGLSVNHVMVITFGRFKRAVDEMGCVYSTVDRRYYHVNLPGGEQYQEINLQPGYQDLCGAQALQFVSYRHADTSLVRDARDQSFLLDVKKQYGPTLADNAHKFEHIFGQAVQADPGLHTTAGILNLLGTLISSSGRRVRQVPFQVNLLPTYDTATPQQIAASVHAFLYGGSSLPKHSTAAIARAVHRHQGTATLPLVPTSSDELAKARAAAGGMPFPLEYPRGQDAAGANTPVYLRDYLIHAPDGTAYPAYVAVFSAGQLGQYYDVQGMAWTTAPQLDRPDQTIRVAGRTYYLYYEGQRLKLVAWYEHGAVYWIRNSLTDSIGNEELLAIAAQTNPVTATGAAPAHPHLTLKAAPVPVRTSAKPETNLTQALGSLGGLLTLGAVPVLAIALLKRRSELKELRAQLHDNLHLEARLSAAIAHASSSAPAAASSPPLYSAMNVYVKPGLRVRRPVLAAGVVAVAAAGALGVLLSAAGGHAATAPTHHTTRARARLPTAPVTVLDAGSTVDAARRLALQLHTDGVRVATVGHLGGSRPPGLWILYAPPARTEAERLARLLKQRAPTIAPIDPVAQAAAGSSVQIAVVIT